MLLTLLNVLRSLIKDWEPQIGNIGHLSLTLNGEALRDFMLASDCWYKARAEESIESTFENFDRFL